MSRCFFSVPVKDELTTAVQVNHMLCKRELHGRMNQTQHSAVYARELVKQRALNLSAFGTETATVPHNE